MRRLSLNDTIFYNLGDCYITGVFVLDGPCDLAALLAEMEGVVDAMPAMGERPMRLGFWTFARGPMPVDLSAHISVIRDPAVTSIEHIIPRLERLRRSTIGADVPPWRIFALNPADQGEAAATNARPLSALMVQARHGLADATRGLQILSRMARFVRQDRHEETARRLPALDPATFADGIAVHDAGLSLLQVPRRGMTRDGDASARLAAVAATLVADQDLFPHAAPLRGNVGRTRVVRRRASENGVGNHLKMVTVATGAPLRPRINIPGLARAQDLPITQWLVAVAPRRIARLAMQVWYSSFDALATLLPLQRRLVLGGRTVTAAFGVPPLWGPVPLVLLALADAEHYHVTVVPGAGFSASREVLLERISGLLNPEAASDVRKLNEAEAAFGEARQQRRAVWPGRRDRTRYGQGAEGSSSSPVSVPASVKSP